MISLAELPEELMLHIFSNSGLRTRELYHLALVNKYFFSLACPLVYREVTLANTRDDRREATEVFTLFEEAIAKSPERALLVRSINITCSNRDGRKLFLTGTYSRVNQLLAKLRSIEELWLTTPDDGLRFPSDFLNGNPALALKRIRLLFARGHMYDIARYSNLPNLDYLELKGWRERNLWPIAMSGSQVPPMLNKVPRLRRLRLGTDGFGPGIAGLLSYCSALTEFTCTVSSYDGRNLSPLMISNSLSPLGQTLATLNLAVGAPTYVDGTGLDLSSLAVLKELSVHGNMLFELRAREILINRCGLYKRLPSSLERLKVCLASIRPSGFVVYIGLGSFWPKYLYSYRSYFPHSKQPSGSTISRLLQRTRWIRRNGCSLPNLMTVTGPLRLWRESVMAQDSRDWNNFI